MNWISTAELDGSVVGTVTAIAYGDTVGWIGMMLVDPQYRRRGIATRLMRRAMEALETCRTIKLDATPLGKTVYEKLGFRDEYSLVRLIRAHAPFDMPSTGGVSPLSAGNLDDISAMDKAAFGADRMNVLAPIAAVNPATAFRLDRDGVLGGYVLGRPGANFYQIGPLVADTPDNAVALAGTAMSVIGAAPIVVDVPADQLEFIGWLVSNCFREERPFIRMYEGENDSPGRPERVFAICGPEVG